MKKLGWKLTNNIKMHNGKIVYQIQYDDGTQGGWVSNELNFDSSGRARILNNAVVIDNAYVGDNAVVCDNAVISENATVTDNARVTGWSQVKGACNVAEHARVSDYSVVRGICRVGGYATLNNHAIVQGAVRMLGFTNLAGTACLDGSFSIDDRIWLERGVWNFKPTVISTPYGLIYENKPNQLIVCGIVIRLRRMNTTKKIRSRLMVSLTHYVDKVMPYVECLVKEIRDRNLLNPLKVIVKSCLVSEIYHPDTLVRYVEPYEPESRPETPWTIRLEENAFYLDNPFLINNGIEEED